MASFRKFAFCFFNTKVNKICIQNLQENENELNLNFKLVYFYLLLLVNCNTAIVYIIENSIKFAIVDFRAVIVV